MSPKLQAQPRVSCYFCPAAKLRKQFVYHGPPTGETKFSFSSAGRYYREVLCCETCGHFQSIHDMDISRLYTEEYVSSTYGNGGIRRTFERVIGLDASRSDNMGRCRRVNEFAAAYLTAPARESRPPTILDVGSGLCVFLHQMKAAGWRGTALDPDSRAVAHARSVVGVEAVCCDFLDVHDLGQFDVVAFNKVLEHVLDPVEMLAKSADYLAAGGFVYVEVPDGEAAATHGPEREEFFIEHHHVFSPASLAMLAQRAGFQARLIERLQEPSTKYTLRGFLTAA